MLVVAAMLIVPALVPVPPAAMASNVLNSRPAMMAIRSVAMGVPMIAHG